MTDVINFEAEMNSSKVTKRCRINDEEDFEKSLDSEDDDDIEKITTIERKTLKRFKDNDEDGSKNKRSKKEMDELFSGESSDKSDKNAAAYSPGENSETFKQEDNDDLILSICKAMQKVRDIFGIDFNVNEFNKHDDSKKNDEIFTIDIPERMQVRSSPVTAASEEELVIEAQWIYKQAFERKTISVQDFHLTAEAKKLAKKGPEIVSKIIITLELVKNQHFEVPFIAFYRKEYVLPELNINDLWKIYKFDAQWHQLNQRREALLNLLQFVKCYQETNESQHTRLIKNDDIEQLREVQTIEELNDFYQLFLLHYYHEFSKEERVDCDSYSIFREADLNCFAKKFGLSPRQFAENLSQESQVYKIERETTTPHVLALIYINKNFQTPEKIVKAAQSMVGIQISREPLIRESVRKLYFAKAKISVRPTKEGIQAIGENHPIYSMKYLKDKPVNDLVGDQYLKLSMAQEQQLITISFSDEIDTNYMERMKRLCCRNESDKHVQEWNLLRTSSLEIALRKILISDLKKELHSILLKEAKDCVMRHCTRKMYNWIKTAPYRCNYPKNEDWDTTKGLRVMGIAYVPHYSVAAFACMIGFNGECTDFINLPNILTMNNSDKAKMDSVLTGIKNIITTKKPHVIAISGESSEAITIAQNIRQVITNLASDRYFSKISVEIVENGPAVVYSTSRKGVAEFPKYPVALRQAISLARRLQNPLVEFSQLCNVDNEILSLKFHNLQDQLSKEDLRDNIYLEFVNRVNEVGVDVNKAAQIPYFENLVQFVCGLGPHKARYLLGTLKKVNRQLENRQQLTTLCHMGPKLFTNCAGFIKIDTENLSNSAKERVEALDGSRVHPENYDWAEKIAADALDYDENINSAVALKEIFAFPEKLKELNLDAFAKELERQGFGNKCVTVYDIRSELICRYKDLRIPYKSPTANQLFQIIVKETPEEFYVGKLVEATILTVCYVYVWLRLDNGIYSYIQVNNLSEECLAHPEKRLRVGSRIYCRILRIETEKFCVEASSKASDIADSNGEWRLPKDKYYDSVAEDTDDKIRNMKHMDTKHTNIHPYFKNINYADAETLMQTMKPGEMIIRPSSKGKGRLCLTWKVTEYVNQYIHVRDDNKNLWIGDEIFRNFDEIITRHINPMAALASELLKFKYYMPQIMGLQDRADEVLRQQQRKNPKGIPYIVSALKHNPGRFMLSYLHRNQCQHDNITIRPSGLKFRGYRFAGLNDLIHWFKEHSKGSIP